MTHADAHDWNLGALDELAEIVNGRLAVGWVARAVGDKYAIEMVSNFMDRVVKGESGYACTAGNEASEDVLLDAAVDQSNMHVSEGGAHMKWSFGGDTADQVNGLRVLFYSAWKREGNKSTTPS